jgi:hypothetical protein
VEQLGQRPVGQDLEGIGLDSLLELGAGEPDGAGKTGLLGRVPGGGRRASAGGAVDRVAAGVTDIGLRASGASARDSRRGTVAWLIPGSASYSARIPITGLPEPAVATKAVGMPATPRSTAKPACSRRRMSSEEAWCS